MAWRRTCLQVTAKRNRQVAKKRQVRQEYLSVKARHRPKVVAYFSNLANLAFLGDLAVKLSASWKSDYR